MPIRRGCERYAVLAVLMITACPSWAQPMTCAQFNALGTPARTAEQAAATSATKPQVEEYKKVVADYAARLSIPGVSSRARALQVIRKNNQLTEVIRDALAVTRGSCFSRPSAMMADVAIDDFNYFLDTIAKRLKL